ncbi:MAG TPA: DUF308 domain-containing protein [Streptosporangiaceae bacterium]
MSTPRSTRPDQPGPSGPPPAAGYAPGTEPEQARFGAALGFAASAWPAFLAAAIGGVAVGIILLVWPKATLIVAAVLVGASLIVAGLLRLIDGFTAHDASGGRRVAGVLIGLLAIVAGLYCIRHYNIVIGVLAIVVGLFWVIYGIADIGVSLFGGPFPGRGLTLAAGALSLAAGLILLFWPSITVVVLVRVIGIWLIVYGLMMAITAFSLRRAASAARERGEMASV